MGVAGPFLSADPYLRATSTVESATSYTLDARAGLEASAGVSAGLGDLFKVPGLPDASWSWTFADVSTSLPGYPKTLQVWGSGGSGGSGGGTDTVPGGVNVTIN
jgi:hypothetical protein